MFGLSLSPAIYVAGFLAFAASAWWFIDTVGDIREANVRAEYDQALAETNEDVEANSEVQTKVSNARKLVRDKAVRDALSRPGGCKMTAEDAADLNRIKAR